MPDLDYAASMPQDLLRRATAFRRIARWCAFIPMTLGIAITLLYGLFDFDALVKAGLYLLPIGTIIVLTGLLFTLLSHLQFRDYAHITRTPSPSDALRTCLLLLANFGIAIPCVIVGFFLAIGPQWGVVVHNDTGAPLTCRIHSFWSPHSTIILSPGGSTDQAFRPRRAKGLTLHLQQAGITKDIPLTTPGGDLLENGRNVDIHVGPNLSLETHAVAGS